MCFESRNLCCTEEPEGQFGQLKSGKSGRIYFFLRDIKSTTAPFRCFFAADLDWTSHSKGLLRACFLRPFLGFYYSLSLSKVILWELQYKVRSKGTLWKPSKDIFFWILTEPQRVPFENSRTLFSFFVFFIRFYYYETLSPFYELSQSCPLALCAGGPQRALA